MISNGEKSFHDPGLTEVDFAVRSVLADLQAPPGREITKRRHDGNEVFAGRLLSLSLAESLPSGLRQIQAAPGTVVTPLARDYLKHRGVEIKFVAKGEIQQLRNMGEWGFAIESVSGLIEAFRRSLLAETETWVEVGNTLEQATSWLTRGEGRGVMMLTDEASAAVYRACRMPGVRAAGTNEPEAVARAVRGLGVNLLAIEPAGKSISSLRQLGTTFRRGGGPIPPKWLAEGVMS